MSSFKGHRNTQSSLRERLTNISDKIIVKTKKIKLYKSNNNTLRPEKKEINKVPKLYWGER